jgi:hypothetical protein
MANKEDDVTKEEARVGDLTVDESQQDQVKGGHPNLKFTLSEEYSH